MFTLSLAPRAQGDAESLGEEDMKNTTIITIIVVIALLVGFYIFTSSNRYYISASKDGVSYKIDKRTGETWGIYRGELYPVEEPEPEAPTPPIQDIPPSEQSKITGNAGLKYGTLFSGKLYNGSQWYVRELHLMITAKDSDGSVRWSREFKDDVFIDSLTTGSFQVEVTGAMEAKMS